MVKIEKDKIFKFRDIFFVHVKNVSNECIIVDEYKKETEMMWLIDEKKFLSQSDFLNAYTNHRIGILWVDESSLRIDDLQKIISYRKIEEKNNQKEKEGFFKRIKKCLKSSN